MALTQVFAAGEILTAAKLNASSIPIVSSTADITAPYTNQIIYNSAIPGLQKYSGSAWVLFDANTTWISKSANETVTSSTTMQSDDSFAFTVVANAVYVLEGYVIYTAASAAGDIKYDFTVPAGASIRWTAFGNSGAAGSLTDYNMVVQTASSSRSSGGNDPTEMSFQPKGKLTTAGTAGTLQFRWAQDTSSATGTVVLSDSWMKLTRII